MEKILQIFSIFGLLFLIVGMISYFSSHFFFVKGYKNLDKYAKIVGFISIPAVLIFSGLKIGLISILIIWITSTLGALVAKLTHRPPSMTAQSLLEEDLQDFLKTKSGEYFINRYPEQFKIFWESVPHGEAFRFAGLIKTKNRDFLSNIPAEDIRLFLISLSYVILIDQVVYTHFKDRYEQFKQRNNPPKMTIGWTNSNPWMVLHENVLNSRDIDTASFIKDFNMFTKFFVNYVSVYVGYVNDHQLAEALLHDKDVISGTYGEILKGYIVARQDRLNDEWMRWQVERAIAARKNGRTSL